MAGVRNARGQVRDLDTGEIVIRVDRFGCARQMTEADRVAENIEAIKVASEPPWQCGDAVSGQLAPARPRIERFQPSALVDDGKGGTKVEMNGYRGRDGARVSDVFDRMVNQAIRAHAAKGKKAGPFVPPFSWGQVQMARDYAALTERCSASGVKCSSLESLRQSGSSGGDREAAIFADFARLRSLHRRIGDGLAKKLRRYRPSDSSAGPDPRRAITTRRLVDQICLAGLTPKEILQADGWSGNANQISDLRSDLCMALDRMQGYRPDRAQNMD